tara:strand:+ start:534 stop:707 length:174 start_codon:yes stop_codon:yes gene_type:complete
MYSIKTELLEDEIHLILEAIVALGPISWEDPQGSDRRLTRDSILGKLTREPGVCQFN